MRGRGKLLALLRGVLLGVLLGGLLGGSEVRADVRQFEDSTYPAVVAQLQDVARRFPRYATLVTAQEEYGLQEIVHAKTPGGPFRNYLLLVGEHFSTLTDADDAAHQQEQEQQQGREQGQAQGQVTEVPAVFISGEVHGDERVGPLATMELARVLIMSAHCSRERRLATDGQREQRWRGLRQTRAEAQGEEEPVADCEEFTATTMPSLADQAWLAYLVRTRRIVLSPMTNAQGYAANTRQEAGVDINRDFPYQISGKNCMVTIGARVVNEVFRDHVPIVSITFHGGMEAIAYEWGSRNHKTRDVSPDDVSQSMIGSRMATFAGGFGSVSKYRSGRMNQIVYAVTGGLEDWAYAASWENAYTTPHPIGTCNPDSYGGYPLERTTYDPVSVRAFNYLVETSNRKGPGAETLGRNRNILDRSLLAPDNGHVPRNVRLALEAVDIAQPYVCVSNFHAGLPAAPDTENKLRRGLIAAYDGDEPDNGDEDGRNDPQDQEEPDEQDEPDDPDGPDGQQQPHEEEEAVVHLSMEWHVGGAVSVDETQVLIVPVHNILSLPGSKDEWGTVVSCQTHREWADQAVVQECSSALLSCLDAESLHSALDSQAAKDAGVSVASASDVHAGAARWGNPTNPQTPETFHAHLHLHIPHASASASVSTSGGHQTYAVYARARVDQSWGQARESSRPQNVPPQTHLANARTNPDWDMQWNGVRVRGRKDWFSPITLVTIAAPEPGSAAPASLLRVVRSGAPAEPNGRSAIPPGPQCGFNSLSCPAASWLAQNNADPASLFGASTSELGGTDAASLQRFVNVQFTSAFFTGVWSASGDGEQPGADDGTVNPNDGSSGGSGDGDSDGSSNDGYDGEGEGKVTGTESETEWYVSLIVVFFVLAAFLVATVLFVASFRNRKPLQPYKRVPQSDEERLGAREDGESDDGDEVDENGVPIDMNDEDLGLEMVSDHDPSQQRL